MSTKLLRQIDMLEAACHAALERGDDGKTIDVLVRTLTTLRFAVSAEEPPVVRGLTNMATAHAEMLLNSLNAEGNSVLIHAHLQQLCSTLVDLRGAVQHQTDVTR